MSSSRIEQIIEEIEDYIDTCKGPLFSSGDKIVDVYKRQRYCSGISAGKMAS